MVHAQVAAMRKGLEAHRGQPPSRPWQGGHQGPALPQHQGQSRPGSRGF